MTVKYLIQLMVDAWMLFQPTQKSMVLEIGQQGKSVGIVPVKDGHFDELRL